MSYGKTISVMLSILTSWGKHFTARCYASAAYAVVMCPSVSHAGIIPNS